MWCGLKTNPRDKVAHKPTYQRRSWTNTIHKSTNPRQLTRPKSKWTQVDSPINKNRIIKLLKLEILTFENRLVLRFWPACSWGTFIMFVHLVRTAGLNNTIFNCVFTSQLKQAEDSPPCSLKGDNALSHCARPKTTVRLASYQFFLKFLTYFI